MPNGWSFQSTQKDKKSYCLKSHLFRAIHQHKYFHDKQKSSFIYISSCFFVYTSEQIGFFYFIFLQNNVNIS